MSNPYIVEEDKVVRFDMFKIERGRDKLCKCKTPHYELDTTNRIVTCKDCGAVIEPFDAMLKLLEHIDSYKEYQHKALEKCKTYAEWADKEWRRRFKNGCFKDMEKQYMQGIYPHCPNCNELIDPVKMTSWSRKENEVK